MEEYQSLLDSFLRLVRSHFWIEAALALIAALFAIALRRQKRLFKPSGFIMLSFGLLLDMLMPHAPQLEPWMLYWRAAAVTLVLFGTIQLLVETVQVTTHRRSAQFSTIFFELLNAVLYGGVALLVLWFVVGVNPRFLLAVPVLGTLVLGWILQSDFLHGVLLQYHRPFKPGDWVRFGNHLGRVRETGWRATRLVTRSKENIQIPNAVLARELVINYSAEDLVADEVFIGLGYETSPDTVEQAIHTLLRGIPEVRKSEVDVWEYDESAIRYRIRFWIADYAAQEQVRTQILRSLWYSLRRNAIEIPFPTRKVLASGYQPSATTEDDTGRRLIGDLRRVYPTLTDEELELLTPGIRVRQFGRGEILIREGESGDCFYVLRDGQVEVLATKTDGTGEGHVRYVDESSPENFFGETALLTGEPRNATIRAATDVEVLELSREGFAQLFRTKPEAAATIADIAARRAAETNQVRTSADGAPASRVAKVLAMIYSAFDIRR
jgi:small-conductance mechanosensitive channel/CRP-like cAMP-binding protein